MAVYKNLTVVIAVRRVLSCVALDKYYKDQITVPFPMLYGWFLVCIASNQC